MRVGQHAFGFLVRRAALVAVLVAVGVGDLCGCGGCGEQGESRTLDSGVAHAEDFRPSPAQLADKAVRSKTGRLVKVVGADVADDAAVTTGTELGDAVEVAEKDVPPNVLCNVVLDARPVPKSTLYPDGNEYVRNFPDIQKLIDAFRRSGCDPVMIGGSCVPGPVGSCLWNTQLRGADCARAADDPQYVCSGVRDCWTQPPAMKTRLFRTEGLCDDGEDGKVTCEVRWGDERAVAGKRAHIPHGWAGRDRDLNYVGVGGDGKFEELP